MLLEARNLKKVFKERRVRAVDGASLSLEKGLTLGLVGESGSGKSTLARLLLRLLDADEGEIYFEGADIAGRGEKDLKEFRRKAQIVFQHPAASLDPRMRVADILREPFLIQGQRDRAFCDSKVRELLSAVELGAAFRGRTPRELSGGECQRVAIARAISLDPSFIVCDEPVSALDVLVGAQILNLLLKLQKERGVSYLFISHDRRVVRHMSDRILEMKDGKVAPCQ